MGRLGRFRLNASCAALAAGGRPARSAAGLPSCCRHLCPLLAGTAALLKEVYGRDILPVGSLKKKGLPAKVMPLAALPRACTMPQPCCAALDCRASCYATASLSVPRTLPTAPTLPADRADAGGAREQQQRPPAAHQQHRPAQPHLYH